MQRGFTALTYASEHGHREIVKVLLDAGANTELQTEVRIDPLLTVT